LDGLSSRYRIRIVTVCALLVRFSPAYVLSSAS
jgi:hypothetical protein